MWITTTAKGTYARPYSGYCPNWKALSIHESSPGWDIVSRRLAKECAVYTASQYDRSVRLGSLVDAPRMPCKAYRNENLEHQSFQDGLFDVVVAQDVFEHIFHPDLAIKEIARTLKPGGFALMSVPIVNRHRRQSRRRAILRRVMSFTCSNPSITVIQ